MRLFLILTFLIFTRLIFGQPVKSYDYAYQSEKGIFVYSILERKEFKITNISNGACPYISPNGKELSYTENLKNGDRCICVLNLTTKKIKVLKVNSQQCSGPVWSPDGHFIAYEVLNNNESKWRVSIIDTANDKPIDITKNIKSESYSPSWSSDSKSILVHNMDTIFQLNLNGDILNN